VVAVDLERVQVSLAGGGVEEQLARHAGLPGDVASGADRTGVEAAAAAPAAALGHRYADIQVEIGEHGGQAHLWPALGRHEQPRLADPAQAGPGRGRLVSKHAGREPVARFGHRPVHGRGGAERPAAALLKDRDQSVDRPVEQGIQATVLGVIGGGITLLEPRQRAPVDARHE